MNFFIKCDVFVRLASVCAFFEPTTPDETKYLCSCVRLENKKGHAYAIATNHQVASIQYLGQTNEPDGVAHVVLDPQLIAQCQTEAQYSSFLQITTVPEIAIGAAKTMLGYNYPGNACFFPDETPMDKWREWGPDKSVANRGFMYWELDHITALTKTSPSGKIYFPENIDSDKPIVLRDVYDDNWVGLFIPNTNPGQKTPREPASLPAWWV